MISLKNPLLAGLALEGSRLRLPEASRTPPGAARSAPPSFSSEDLSQQSQELKDTASRFSMRSRTSEFSFAPGSWLLGS